MERFRYTWYICYRIYDSYLSLESGNVNKRILYREVYIYILISINAIFCGCPGLPELLYLRTDPHDISPEVFVL